VTKTSSCKIDWQVISWNCWPKWDSSLSVNECSCSECSVHCSFCTKPGVFYLHFTTRTTLSRHVTVLDFGTKHQSTNQWNNHSRFWPVHVRTQFTASLSIPDSQGPERYDFVYHYVFHVGWPSERSLCKIYFVVE